jgi:hypothetical protein
MSIRQLERIATDISLSGPQVSSLGKQITRDFTPQRLPVGWTTVNGCQNVLRHIHRKLAVMVTGEVEQDGKRWMHLSISHRDRLPTWDELKEIKHWILGPDTVAIQVVAPVDQHVNLHPNCLHLWHCLDGSPIPDFRHEGQI